MIDTLPLATTLVAGGFAAICLVTDLRERKIFNVVTYPALAAGFMLALAFGGVPGAELALFGAAVGALPALVAFLAGALGGGDVKLMAALGALVGAARVVEVTFVACVLVVVWSLLRLVGRGVLFRALRTVVRAPARRLKSDDVTHVSFGETLLGPALAVATLLLGFTWGVR